MAAASSGDFVVVWQSLPAQDGSSYGIFGQRFDSGGAPRGAEFRVNTHRKSRQDLPSVASDASGNFVVAWQDRDADSYGVFGQRYDSAGVAQGDEFQINIFTTDRQASPSVGAAGPNQFVVVWESDGQDGSGDGVFGRRLHSRR